MLGPVYPYRGGIAHFTTMLAKHLITAGNSVQVISFKKQYPNWLFPGKSDKDECPGREKVPTDYLLKPLNPLSWIKTTRVISTFNPEQVIIPWWVTFWGPAFHHIISQLNKRGFKPTILIHNTMPHEARFFDRYLAKRTLQAADRYIVMTEKEKTRLLSLLPQTQKIKIASLPIIQPFNATGLQKSQLRRNIGLPIDQPVILFFGIIRPYKGLGVLIDAFKLVIEKGFQAHLLIAGEFWDDKKQYLLKIRDLGLEDKIHIIDDYIPDNEAASYFEAADILVAPYISGTQSAALKTALGFGLPIVATNIIHDKMLDMIPERCRIVPTNDTEGLAKGIIEQLKKPIHDKEKVAQMVSRSWNEMITAVTDVRHSNTTESFGADFEETNQ